MSSLTTRPINLLDANNRAIYDSVDYLAFQGQYDSSNNLIYKGSARPGADPAASVWQIIQLTYDTSNNLLTIKWPIGPFGVASSDFIFSWNNRASYTYG